MYFGALLRYLITGSIAISKCRIWGDQGQAALEKASICLLNCGPTGSETLKNLVLGGVGSITVVDGSKVEEGDLGNNFMGIVSSFCILVLFFISFHHFWLLFVVDESSVGQSKAKCVCSFLQELNDAVKAKFIEEYPQELIETNPSFFSQFTLVIATQVCQYDADNRPYHLIITMYGLDQCFFMLIHVKCNILDGTL